MIFFYGPRGPRERDIPLLIIPITPVDAMENETPIFAGELETKDNRPAWVRDATDEHAHNFDPADPITQAEVLWMWREIESGDMTPDEFLRRSA